ncbi:MAG: hypothetical protein JW751_11975 [Polyangiaceae bacterium]|nr:hypothetical protein [Polyangiaceae bacterium]
MEEEELDIEDFFGSLDKACLREVLRQRIRDGVLLRLIGKWLSVGVVEEGCVYYLDTGVLQGGVISPSCRTRTCTRCSIGGSQSRSGRGCEAKPT